VSFSGTARLVRLALRRDRIRLPVWILALTALQLVEASSVLGLYQTQQERTALALSSARSAVALAFNGLISGTNEGAVVASQGLLFPAVAAAVMSLFIVVRHTRQNEETGRAELIGSAVVGRRSSLTAALLVAAGANVVVGLANTVVLIAMGLPVQGSFALGAAIAGAGIAFAVVAAVTAQISGIARVASGLAGAVLGVAFLLRLVGDVSGHVETEPTVRVIVGSASWLSPIGWAELIRPFDLDVWWVLGLFAAWVVLLVGVAFAMLERRDLGSGMIPERPGRPAALRRLLSPLGLAWRLQRGTLLWWAVAIGVSGISFGAVGNQIDDLIGSSQSAADVFKDLGGGLTNLTDAYFASSIAFVAIAVAGYAIQTLVRMRSEEAGGKLEPVLGTAVSRPRWVASHLTIAVLGTVGLLLLLGLTAGITYGMTIDDLSGQWSSLVGTSLVQAPAVLVLAAVVVLAFGRVPRWTAGVSWGALALCLVVGYLGPTLGLSQAALDISPFSHVPSLGTGIAVLPIAALLSIAVAVAAAGISLFRRRDVPA
jgi:ABC-2 type transport system permease protein